MEAGEALAKLAQPTVVGVCARLGGSGQTYKVLRMHDEATALIEVRSWDEPIPYAVADISLDLAGNSSQERFLPRVGQYRSMGPDGPEYMVVSIVSPTKAQIWVVGDEENQDYEIQDILIDPIVYDGK